MSSGNREAAWGAQVACRGRLKCLVSRWADAIVPFLNLPPAPESASWCHIWDSINPAYTVCPTLEIPRDPAPHNLQAHPSCCSLWMAGLGSCFTTFKILSNKQQLASVSPRPRTSSSQPRFIAWLHLRISKPSTSSSHLGLLYTSGRVALGKTQGKADLGLHHPGNPRPAHPVDSYRPPWSTTTLFLYSWSSTEGRG